MNKSLDMIDKHLINVKNLSAKLVTGKLNSVYVATNINSDMNTVTTGLTEGDFHRLAVLSNGSMTDIISLIGSSGSSGGGGNVNSASTPLSISGGVLSIDLSSYTNTAGLTTLLAGKLDTSHKAGKIGNANVAFGAFDINT